MFSYFLIHFFFKKGETTNFVHLIFNLSFFLHLFLCFIVLSTYYNILINIFFFLKIIFFLHFFSSFFSPANFSTQLTPHTHSLTKLCFSLLFSSRCSHCSSIHYVSSKLSDTSQTRLHLMKHPWILVRH